MSESIESLIGIVVLYNSSIKASKTLTSINESLLKDAVFLDMIVYDNSTHAEMEDGSISTQGQLNIHYFHDPSNPGLGKAYNFAARYAQKLNKHWILLLDQDTSFPEKTIPAYLSAIIDFPGIKLFAPLLKLSDDSILSPCRYRFKRGFALKQISPGLQSFDKLSPINSGMLIELAAFEMSGGYNEKVKLDFSDFQFIERFKKKHDQFYLLNVTALQDFSNAETNTEKLNARFIYYCEGAKNSENRSYTDRFSYTLIVFLRATRLVWRTKEFIFYKTFMHHYLRAS